MHVMASLLHGAPGGKANVGVRAPRRWLRNTDRQASDGPTGLAAGRGPISVGSEARCEGEERKR